MTTTYSDVLEAIEEILQANAWPHTLYISEEVQEDWIDDMKFNDPNQPSESPTVQSFAVETEKDQRMVGKKDNGEKVVVYL